MSTTATTRYAVTQYPTPVFNTPDIHACFGGEDGDSIAVDSNGLLKTVETVLFPNSKIELLERVAQSHVWRIQTGEYSYAGAFYADERFFIQSANIPQNRTKAVPSMPTLIKQLQDMPHCPYIWGGNWPQGINLLPTLYPSKTPISELPPSTQSLWKLKGVDCSGLPYYLTNGYTPRNTSSLIHFGTPVPVEGLNVKSIQERLQDLDFIAWKGHVVWVLSQDLTIESKYPMGLLRSNLCERLEEIMSERTPLDSWKDGAHFVVRRWHPNNI